MMFPDAKPNANVASGPGAGASGHRARHSKFGESEGDFEYDDIDASDAMSTATSTGAKFRDIVHELPLRCGGCVCKGCGAQASDDEPWAQHSPIYDGSEIIAKAPKGRICKLCITTFQCTGLDANYRSIGEFLKFGASPSGRATLQDFLKKRKVLHKEGVDNVTKKAKTIAREVGTTELSLQKVQGRKMKNPKRIFVSRQAWDPDIDGVLDQSKVIKEVLNGKEVEGCWVMKGREGVWEEDTYAEDRMLEDRLEANDTGPFGQERLEHKKNAISKMFADDNAKRQKVTATPPASGLANISDARGLLALLQSSGAGALDESKQKPNQDSNERVEISDDDDDASDDPPPRSAGDFLGFGGQSSGLRPRSTPSQGAAGGGGGTSGKASGRVRAASSRDGVSGTAAIANVSLGSQLGSNSRSLTAVGTQSSFADDGRSQRVVEGINKKIAEEVEPTYTIALCLKDDRLRVAVNKEEKKQLVEYCQEKTKECVMALKALRQVLQKIRGCKAGSAVQVQHEETEKRIVVVNACSDLMTLMTKQQSNPAEFLELIEILSNAGAQMPSQLRLIQFQQTINQLLIVNDAEGACQKCHNGVEIQDLLRRGCTLESIEKLVEGTFLDSILVLATSGLSKPQQQTEPATTSPTKLAIASCIQALVTASKRTSFLAKAIVNDELDDFDLLVSASADPAKVISLVKRFDDYHDLPNQQGAFGPLGTFIFDGAVGKGLISNARKGAENAALEVKTTQRISEIEALGQCVLDADWNPFECKESVVILEELVAPFHKAVQNATSGENPILSAVGRKSSFKLKECHNILLQRFGSIQSKVWDHLRSCARLHCHTKLSRDIMTSAAALQNNGEVTIEPEEGGKVGLIDLTSIKFCLPEIVSQHTLFAASGQGSCQGKDGRAALVALLSDVDSLTKEFFQMVSCVLLHGAQRLRDLLPGKAWATREITGWRAYPMKLHNFFENDCGTNETKRPLAKETMDALSSLVLVLDDVVSANQKQCYGAIRVLVDLFVEGKQVTTIHATKANIPQPTAKNAFLFEWLGTLLEVDPCFFFVAFDSIWATISLKICVGGWRARSCNRKICIGHFFQ